MSFLTVVLYFLIFGGWVYLIRINNGIGIGFRFLYALNMVLFFLIGPILREISGLEISASNPIMFDSSIRLSLYGLLAYLIGSYIAYPVFVGNICLIPADYVEQMEKSDRSYVQRKLAWCLIWIGFFSLPFLRVLRSVPTIGAMGTQMPLLIETGLVMLCINGAYGKRTTLPLVLLILIAKGLVYTAMTGHAGWIFLNGIELVCVAILGIRLKAAKVVILVVCFAIAFIPAQMWLQGRGQLRMAIKREAGIQERIEIAMSIFSSFDTWLVNDQSMISSYKERGDFSDLLATTVAHTPSVQPYGEGESFLTVLVALVPRFLWPDKPFTQGGNDFVSKYSGIIFDRNTSVGMHHMFELYVNFGPLGVIIGMFFIGFGIGWMESSYYRKGSRNLIVEVLLIFSSWCICLYSDQMAGLVMTLIPALVLCMVICTAIAFHIRSRFLPNHLLGAEKTANSSTMKE